MPHLLCQNKAICWEIYEWIFNFSLDHATQKKRPQPPRRVNWSYCGGGLFEKRPSPTPPLKNFSWRVWINAAGKSLRHGKMQKKAAEQQCKSLWSISAASQKPSPLLHSSLLLIHLGLLRMRQPLRPLSKTSDEVDENIVLQISSTEQERKERHRIPREDDILPYRHLNISAYPDPIQSFNSSFFILHSSLLFCLPPGWEQGAGGYRSRTKDIATGGYGIRPYGNRVCYPHRPEHRKRGKQPIRGRGGACSSRMFDESKALRRGCKRTNAVDWKSISECNGWRSAIMSEHIDAMIILHEKAGGAMPFVANGIAPPLP